MEIKLIIPDYDANSGIRYAWKDGFEIEVQVKDGVVSIVANKSGLLSLANHLLNLSQDTIPAGYHLHFDEHNSLDDGSAELVIQKK